MSLEDELSRVMTKLRRWRMFFASWQLGTRPEGDGEVQAVKDHRDLTIVLRAEVTALTGLLMKKGMFTKEEIQYALIREAKDLDRAYSDAYPGFKSTEEGLDMKMPEALETMRRLGFPP